ncbi:hypothetical protein BJF83_24455 [Nocardiopsis sp. CNR-923]|uniref:DUF6507 family protein n=1 Tax=Nocardiopsis sp. CNR-923 TaxID=1904965 RepID=UPI00095DDA64|nr:DUF6507 family protein [Nocardiopsis sp. CNR-923]OLT30769.1 hypothetical protein BJF83_24455 [Nocardiopsis sp. CNR-923]
MPGWNIQVPEVSGVLNQVHDHIGDEDATTGLTGTMTNLAERLEEVSTHAASAPIGIALAEFAEHYFGVLGQTVGLAASAVSGAGEATLFYVQGNDAMAAQSQANAGQIPD